MTPADTFFDRMEATDHFTLSSFSGRVIEFIATEHTAKNTMITAVRGRPKGDDAVAARIREFAAFYGVRRQTLAARLGFDVS